MNHPRMTTNGRALAAVFGILVAVLLPKKVECGYADADTRTCGHENVLHRWCTTYELEPLGFYLIEHLVKRDVGFAYTTGEDCR